MLPEDLNSRTDSQSSIIKKSSSVVCLDKFDVSGNLLASNWHSIEYSYPMIIELPKLTFMAIGQVIHGKAGNTLVLWGTVPLSSKRFSLNICPQPYCAEKNKDTVILFHFNPRSSVHNKNIIQNSFVNGLWNKPTQINDQINIPVGSKFQIIICIEPNAFKVFLNGKLISIFKNRCNPRFLRQGESLYLIVPVNEELYGDQEDVIIHRVWWGYWNETVAQSSLSLN